MKVSKRPFVGLAMGLLLGAIAQAGQIVVPTDQPDLQSAINAASFGDIILVRTAAFQDPVTINTKVTIVGDPVCNIRIGYAGFCNGGAGTPAITMAGPGGSTLELVNVTTIPTEDCFFPAAAIEGGGFSQLAIYDSTINPSFSGFSGVGNGAPGIRTTIPSIFVSNSSVRGSNPDTDGTTCSTPPPGREAGIDAPGSVVMVFDSTVTGGQMFASRCCEGCACPGTLPGPEGTGGDGIIADRVFHDVNSNIQGGAGASFVAYPGSIFGGGGVSCGNLPDGAPIVANQVVQLSNDLTGSGQMRIGKPYTLTWNTSSAASVLYYAFGPRQVPVLLGSSGWVFGDPSTAGVLGVVPGGPQISTFNMPFSPGLIGVELMFQMLDSIDGVSRPVGGILQP